MYKHSTTHRTLSRRLAALLAALALLAAMALPVYAEALDGTTQMQEIVETDSNGETDNNDETGSDVDTGTDADTDNKSETNEDTGTGADTDSNDTNDNASPNPGANSTAPADNAAADKTAPCEEKTDLTEEDTADDGEGPADEAGAKETFFAADTCSEDETGSSDMSAPMAASNEGETTTIYFAVDSSYNETYRVNLYVQKNNGEGLNKDMSDTGKKIRDSDGTERKIFSVTLSQADYPGGGFDRLIFQYFTGTTWKRDFFAFGGRSNGDKAWTSIDKIAGKMYDGQKYGSNPGQAFNESQWTRVEYAGMPLYFKNASDAPLAGVTATFYKKDENGDFVVTGSQMIGTVEAGTIAGQKITIPDNQSQFVKFTWEGNDKGTLYYNFSNEVCDGIANFDLVANNCFVYSGSTESSWQNAGSDLLTKDKIIYFDATLSSYAYTGDSDIHQKPMPGKDGTMYCYLTDGSNNIIKRQMTLETAADGTDRQLWFCTVPEGGPFTAVQFSAHPNADENSVVDALTKKYSTAEIPPNLKAPCFFADDGDPSAYTSGNDVCRDGYWDEKGAVRDAESGKGTTVVDIASDKFTQEAGTKYITSTLYDYYTDYELNGFNRDTYPDSTTTSQRGFVTFEQFDRALSSAYTNGNVKYPLYTGHFQPSLWDNKFADVAPGMGLYGWSDDTGSTEYRTFMAVNNSVLDTDGNATDSEAGYARTFQGLVEDKTSTGNANGLPVLKGKTGTGNLVDPHFNKEFLEGKNTFNTVLGKVYEDVAFPFTQDAVFKNDSDKNDKENVAKYWYYDSSQSSLYLTQDEGNSKFFLKSTKNEKGELTTDIKSENRDYKNDPKWTDGSITHGFFPFNKSVGSGGASQYNYGFGAKLQFDFTLTDDGMVQVGDDPKDKVPIKFFFSGDDDVWVYIDGRLVLDVGGAHGKASGLLEFGGNGKENTVTPYVSSNKTGGATYTDGAGGKSVYFNGNEVKFEKKGTILGKDGKPFTLAKGTTHTLTMFYMERGMWESNMAVAFNFPDNNELQVQKEVDLSKVHEDFKPLFQNQKLFTFDLRNLATHYGTKPIHDDTPKPVAVGSAFSAHSSPTEHTTMEKVDNPHDPGTTTGQTVKWYAQGYDKNSEHRSLRYGTMTLNSPLNIEKRDYLSFDVYAVGNKDDGVLSTDYLYLTLVDSSGKQMGCDANGQKSYLNTMLSGSVVMKNNQWVTVKLQLDKMPNYKDFDLTKLSKILIGDDYERTVYFRNFVFTAKPVANKTVGFSVEQADIPDYGSAESGELMPAGGAIFTSSVASNGTQAVDTDGTFDLQDGETVTFTDQFRRGSYISLQEVKNPALYDTCWEVYENGTLVSTAGTSSSVSGVTPTQLKGTDTKPEDNRTEAQDNPSTGSNYNGSKPKENTLVFRSYAAPEEEFPKLKVKFVNTVKVGTLVIKKEQPKDETPLEGKYHFTVTFNNVGGIGLGGADGIKKTKDLAVGESWEIAGIPVGTRFQVVEDTPTDSSLQSVTCDAADATKHDVDNGVRGTVASEAQVTATFTNTAHQLMDITVEKQWQDTNGHLLTDNKSDTVWVKLQRRHASTTDDPWKDATNPVKLTYDYMSNTWTHKFERLDKTDVSSGTYYEYRVLESATGNDDWHGGTDDDVIEISGKKYKVLNTTRVTGDSPDKTLTLTNKRLDPKFTLDITKKDAEDGKKLLAGVEFTLEKLKKDDNGKLVVDKSFKKLTGVTNADGKPMLKGEDGKPTDASAFTGLEAGKYRLTETKAAENYNLLSAPIEVEFTKTGECWLNGSEIKVGTEEKPTYFTKDGNDRYTLALTVLNRKTPALPHTGADAPSLWLLIGLPLAVAGLLILVFRYNKKGGRTR